MNGKGKVANDKENPAGAGLIRKLFEESFVVLDCCGALLEGAQKFGFCHPNRIAFDCPAKDRLAVSEVFFLYEGNSANARPIFLLRAHLRSFLFEAPRGDIGGRPKSFWRFLGHAHIGHRLA